MFKLESCYRERHIALAPFAILPLALNTLLPSFSPLSEAVLRFLFPESLGSCCPGWSTPLKLHHEFSKKRNCNRLSRWQSQDLKCSAGYPRPPLLRQPREVDLGPLHTRPAPVQQPVCSSCPHLRKGITIAPDPLVALRIKEQGGSWRPGAGEAQSRLVTVMVTGNTEVSPRDPALPQPRAVAQPLVFIHITKFSYISQGTVRITLILKVCEKD